MLSQQRFLKCLFPSSPPPACSVLSVSSVTCFWYIRLAKHRCLITLTSHFFSLKHYQSVGSLLKRRTGRLDLSELCTASDRRPTYHNATDNRQWSKSRICKVLSGAELVWSGQFPLTTSGCLSANHSRLLKDIKHTCVGSDATTQAVLDALKG